MQYAKQSLHGAAGSTMDSTEEAVEGAHSAVEKTLGTEKAQLNKLPKTLKMKYQTLPTRLKVGI